MRDVFEIRGLSFGNRSYECEDKDEDENEDRGSEEVGSFLSSRVCQNIRMAIELERALNTGSIGSCTARCCETNINHHHPQEPSARPGGKFK